MVLSPLIFALERWDNLDNGPYFKLYNFSLLGLDKVGVPLELSLNFSGPPLTAGKYFEGPPLALAEVFRAPPKYCIYFSGPPLVFIRPSPGGY